MCIFYKIQLFTLVLFSFNLPFVKILNKILKMFDLLYGTAEEQCVYFPKYSYLHKCSSVSVYHLLKL